MPLGPFFFANARNQMAGQMARGDAARASSQARDAAQAASDVERRLDKLSMICMAMWSFIQEKMNVTEEQLMERIKQIDLLDGEADGKVKPRQLAKCPQCGRVMSPRHAHCIYCGAEKLNIGAFDDVL